MKQLNINQMKELSGLKNWEEQAQLIKQQSEKSTVGEINWEAYPYHPEVVFYTAWANRSFYLLFEVQENAIRAVNTAYHSPVYEDSCVEFFIQHPGESTYRNFEFNCIGTVLASLRESRSQCQYFSSTEMDKIIIHTSLPRETIEKEGTCNWQLLAEIPFSLIGITEDESPAGKTARANFYKCGDKTPTPHFLSWNPIGTEQPDFHRPEFFGEIRFQ